MTDEDARWLGQVRAGSPPDGFAHRDHLKVAWLLLAAHGDLRTAQEDMSAIIRRIAEANGVPQKYHRTVTDAWVAVVAHFRGADPELGFDDLLTAHPVLLDKEALRRHYSAETLGSDVARRDYVAPDVAPIPA
jgi:hypothetical protein